MLIEIGGKEFDISEEILLENKNCLISLHLKNTEMLNEKIKYNDRNPLIFEYFVIPLMKNELSFIKILDNIKFLKNIIEIKSYYQLLEISEFTKEIKEELNFFGFNSIKNKLEKEKNIIDFIVFDNLIKKIICNIDDLIINILYGKTNFPFNAILSYKYKFLSHFPISPKLDESIIDIFFNFEKILLNYFNDSFSVKLTKQKCVQIYINYFSSPGIEFSVWQRVIFTKEATIKKIIELLKNSDLKEYFVETIINIINNDIISYNEYSGNIEKFKEINKNITTVNNDTNIQFINISYKELFDGDFYDQNYFYVSGKFYNTIPSISKYSQINKITISGLDILLKEYI